MGFQKFNRAESYEPVSKKEIEAQLVAKTIAAQEAKIETAKRLGVDPRTL